MIDEEFEPVSCPRCGEGLWYEADAAGRVEMRVDGIAESGSLLTSMIQAREVREDMNGVIAAGRLPDRPAPNRRRAGAPRLGIGAAPTPTAHESEMGVR